MHRTEDQDRTYACKDDVLDLAVRHEGGRMAASFRCSCQLVFPTETARKEHVIHEETGNGRAFYGIE